MNVVIKNHCSEIEIMTEGEFEKMNEELDEFDGMHPYVFKGYLLDNKRAEKVELQFVVDIVGHDKEIIEQMYNDWLKSPSKNNKPSTGL